nr:MAG TPA: YvrJ protein family protein [Caudoviricetes sp.]
MDTFVQLIGSLGFPIAMCVYMCYYNQKLNDAHKEEVKALREAIENNTQAITELKERL